MAICEYCGAEYKPKQSRSVYCSRKCQIRGYYNKNIKASAVIKNCAWCGNEFEAKHNRIKYCSEHCSIKAADKQRAINAEKCKAKREPTKCLHCGEEFLPSSKKQMFCSKSCSSKHNGEKRTEEAKKRREEGRPKEYRGARLYPYRKNDGIEVAAPKPKTVAKLSPASQRWAKMSWMDLTKELLYYGIGYRESQLMAKDNTLPKDFGLKRKRKR